MEDSLFDHLSRGDQIGETCAQRRPLRLKPTTPIVTRGRLDHEFLDAELVGPSAPPPASTATHGGPYAPSHIERAGTRRREISSTASL